MNDFIFSNDFYKNIDLMVYTTGHEKCLPSHSYGPAVRSSYMVHYIHSGKGIYQARGREWHLQTGDLFLMIPGERIYYEADKENPWEYLWIGLQGIKVEEYLKRTTLPENLVEKLDDQQEIVSFFNEIEMHHQSLNSDLMLNGMAYRFMYMLCETFPAHRERKALSAENYTDLILAYIEQNFERPITIQEIADEFALDRSYIFRIFKKRMNMSIKDYILSLRMANACSYLMNTDLSISDISRSVGYDDVLYFSKLFHKKKGMSPTAYRQKKRPHRSADAKMGEELKD